MSNLARLQAVSSSLDTALDKAENLPEAGSGGGENIETCTVTITHSFPYLWTAFYNSLENNSIIGKSEPLSFGGGAGAATITAIQGSVVVFIDAMNIGSSADFGMENCSISNGGAVLGSIQEIVEFSTCAIAIQLPKTSTCTIAFT